MRGWIALAILLGLVAAVVGIARFALLGVILFPLVARAFGILASIVGLLSVKANEKDDPMKSLNRGSANGAKSGC